MSNKARNTAAIKRGFRNLTTNKDKIIERGMIRLLDAALDYLHEAHDMFRERMRHEQEENTLGWALFHNGEMRMAVSQQKGELTPRGDALSRLRALSSEHPAGWVGVVLSDMANEWYRVDWEEKFLHFSAENTKAIFKECFKPL